MSDDAAEKKSRRGKVEKGKKGEAASFAPGGAKGPRAFDAETFARELHLYWENGAGESFIIGQGEKLAKGAGGAGEELLAMKPTVWSKWPQKKVENRLRQKFVRVKPREGETLGEVDRVLLHVMEHRRLEMSMSALAGYSAGIYDMDGLQILVRTSPRLVEPKEGEWETVRALIHSKLDFSWGTGDAHGVDQTGFFHGWMKMALEGLYLGGPGNFRPGQCCIFAGPRDSGKSRLQHQVITGLLGGRSADPGPYLFGRTDFNGEMFSAEHLMMEDPASSTKTTDRVFFGEMLKQLVVNDTLRLHRKREDALTVSPFFRTTISINDDPDKMRVLPLLTPDMKDKVNLFLVSPHPLPMPTATLGERAAFRGAIEAELPAYAWWLLNVHVIEEGLRSERFGVREWHHPTLAAELFEDTPAAELLQIVDAATFKAGGEDAGQGYKLWDLKSDAKEMGQEWIGSALELERLLLGDGGWLCSLDREAKRVCMHNKIDRLLSRLKEDQPDRVSPKRSNAKRGWRIVPPSA